MPTFYTASDTSQLTDVQVSTSTASVTTTTGTVAVTTFQFPSTTASATTHTFQSLHQGSLTFDGISDFPLDDHVPLNACVHDIAAGMSAPRFVVSSTTATTTSTSCMWLTSSACAALRLARNVTRLAYFEFPPTPIPSRYLATFSRHSAASDMAAAVFDDGFHEAVSLVDFASPTGRRGFISVSSPPAEAPTNATPSYSTKSGACPNGTFGPLGNCQVCPVGSYCISGVQ